MKRLARAYHGLQISQAYINAVKNFKRTIWNPTVSRSGYGFSLQRSSSQQVRRSADLQSPQDNRMCLCLALARLTSVCALIVSGG